MTYICYYIWLTPVYIQGLHLSLHMTHTCHNTTYTLYHMTHTCHHTWPTRHHTRPTPVISYLTIHTCLHVWSMPPNVTQYSTQRAEKASKFICRTITSAHRTHCFHNFNIFTNSESGSKRISGLLLQYHCTRVTRPTIITKSDWQIGKRAFCRQEWPRSYDRPIMAPNTRSRTRFPFSSKYRIHKIL